MHFCHSIIVPRINEDIVKMSLLRALLKYTGIATRMLGNSNIADFYTSTNSDKKWSEYTKEQKEYIIIVCIGAIISLLSFPTFILGGIASYQVIWPKSDDGRSAHLDENDFYIKTLKCISSAQKCQMEVCVEQFRAQFPSSDKLRALKDITTKAELVLQCSAPQIPEALNNWRRFGVKASAQNIELLRGIKENDKYLSDTGTWREIKAVQDIFDAPSIQLSPATLSRLPVYVRSEQQSEQAKLLITMLIDRLRDAKFQTSNDQQHAAIIFVLREPKTNSSYDPSKARVTYNAHATLRAYAFYNANNEIFGEFFEAGDFPPTTQYVSPERREACALLDAGFNVTDKFIETVGLKRQPYRPSC